MGGVFVEIENAGQQKYAEFVSERAKKLQTGMIVWGSLLCLALICLFSNVVMAAVFAAMGIFLAVTNLKAQKKFKEKLSNVDNQEEFFRQIAAKDMIEFPDEHIMITRDYVLVFLTDIFIYQMNDMEKIEVGKQADIKKVLFLTDKNGKRHEIISCTKGDGRQEDFDKVYGVLHERMKR